MDTIGTKAPDLTDASAGGAGKTHAKTMVLPGLTTTRTRALMRTQALDLMFLIGLGGVFLVNAVVAVVRPEGFRDLVASSPMGSLVDPAVVTPLVTLNDLALGLAVVLTARYSRLRLPVLAWAGIWLLVVTFMKATTLTG